MSTTQNDSSVFSTDPLAAPGVPRRRPVSWRSLLLGLAGVAFICGLTYYNDYAMNSTFLVGNFMPIGLMLFFLVFILAINTPLLRFSPRRALSGGELTVALSMMLVACTIPSSGLMRYLPGTLIGFHHNAANNKEFEDLLQKVRLPHWLFPTPRTYSPDDVANRGNDDVVEKFFTRDSEAPETVVGQVRAVPWGAWARPALSWGIFLACMYGAVLFLCVLVRRQWVENERLPFPLATVYLSLVEAPPPGRALNSLFSARSFWLAAGAVFAMHALSALGTYYAPKYCPKISFSYDLTSVMADNVLRFTDPNYVQKHAIYFCVIGLTFFLQSKVAFSLWFFLVLAQIAQVFTGSYQAEFSDAMRIDQSMGAALIFVLMIVWVGRHQWTLILWQMFRGARPDEPQGRYLSYPIAGWGFVLCTVGMIGWLRVAGCSWIGGSAVALLLLTFLLLVARVVAETGLLFVQFPVGNSGALSRAFVYVFPGLGASTRMAEAKSLFFAQWFHVMFLHDVREALPVYGTQAMRVADEAAYAGERNWRRAAPFFVSLVLALVVGYVVAGASTLLVEYRHASTLGVNPTTPINAYGTDSSPRNVMAKVNESMPPRTGPAEAHSRAGHFGFGTLLAGTLAFLRLRFAAWPLHPVGFLLCYSYPIRVIWLSIFIGWVAKVMIVRFGGSSLFRAARPLFIGLAVGEASAAAFWLVVGLVLNWLGMPYYPVKILPG